MWSRIFSGAATAVAGCGVASIASISAQAAARIKVTAHGDERSKAMVARVVGRGMDVAGMKAGALAGSVRSGM